MWIHHTFRTKEKIPFHHKNTTTCCQNIELPKIPLYDVEVPQIRRNVETTPQAIELKFVSSKKATNIIK